ncbi:hypothetical protein HLH17_02240 [Acinetobacter sp. ANC 5380]|uniref:Lipoprotein n=1 Tax=Acinetobacter terrae TaxID=2731247 RepID=A0A7Y2W9L8_9GAMM|nr:hypothetical protein [Acinetobacter terrae]NNH76521.1 hypothetical protein [Acinetobacter terrae]
MKSTFRIAIFSAILLSLVGCTSNSVKTTPKLFAAPMLNDCISKVSSELFNNQIQSFSDPKIQINQPEVQDLTYFAKSVKSYIAQETEALSKYQEKLDGKPIFHVFNIDMKNEKNSVSCSYIFSTDHKSRMDQKPVLFKIQSGKRVEFMSNQNHIDAISPIEFLFDLPFKKQGVRLFDLEYSGTTKLKNEASNNQILDRIHDVVSSNNLLEFYQMSEPLSPEKAALLANEAVASVEFPHFIRPNTIHVVVPPNKYLQKDKEEIKPAYLQNLDKFNERRFVDAETGINTSTEILNEMKRELGLATGNSPTTSISHEPELDIKTSGYTSAELAEIRRTESR